MRRRWRDLPVFAPAPQSAADRLTITNLRAWRLKEPASGRRYTVLKLESRGGDAGYGEGGQAPLTDIAAAKSAVVGIRATQAELVRHKLAALPAMEAAVNNALLDLLANSTKTPIYQYLGGPTRFKARVLAHLEGKDESALGAPLKRAVQQGFKAVTVPIPARDSMWRMQDYVDIVRRRMEKMREMAGPDVDLVLDGSGTLMPGDAAFIATALERFHVLWFDEPTNVLTNDGLAKITDESVMPVGLGRHVYDIAAFQNLLRWGCIDLLRPSTGLNSLVKIRRMAAIAETHYVAVAPYHNGGPIGSMAGIHLSASLANSFIQQIPVPAAEQDAAMRAELTSGNCEVAKDGFAPLLNQPGLGVQVNEQALNKYSEETV